MLSDVAGILGGLTRGVAADDRRGATGAAHLLHAVADTFGLRLRSVRREPGRRRVARRQRLPLQVHRGRHLRRVSPGSAAPSSPIVAVNVYREGQTDGRGYIGLAAMIFGNWRPGGLAVGAGLFGYTDALQLRRGGESVHALLLFVGSLLVAGRVWLALPRGSGCAAPSLVAAAAASSGTSRPTVPDEFSRSRPTSRPCSCSLWPPSAPDASSRRPALPAGSGWLSVTRADWGRCGRRRAR